MTQNEAAQLAQKIGDIAEDLLLQINDLQIKPNDIELYYLGLLRRNRIILRDTSVILTNNLPQNIGSSFILLRVLLDDFIRLFSVHYSDDSQEEIIKIQADAHKHRLLNIKESIKNNDLYGGVNKQLINNTSYEEEKQKFIANPEFDKFFSDKSKFKFKSPLQLKEVFQNREASPETKAANVHAYMAYKFLTQYVHYSNLTHYLDNDDETRKIEIHQIEDTLFFSFKSILLIFNFLSVKYLLKWNGIEISKYFIEKTSPI